jgi:type III restriction enzyme
MSFLYDTLVQEFGKREIARIPVPNFVSDNLKPGFGQRPYQIESFQRCIIWQQEAERLW